MEILAHRTFDVLPLFSSSREILGGWTHDDSFFHHIVESIE
jgi:hypothetical protein